MFITQPSIGVKLYCQTQSLCNNKVNKDEVLFNPTLESYQHLRIAEE
jgi:hypothetical protein